MKRREALHQLFILTAGTALLPGCVARDTIFDASRHLLVIEGKAAEFVEQLAGIILPVGDLQFATPESLVQFISTMMNDCHSPEQIEQFGLGYKEYKSYLSKTFTNSIDGLSYDEEQQLFAAIEDREVMTENAKFFFGKLKQLAQIHFTTSSKYLQEYNAYEMIPGRFNGCVDTT